MGVGAAPSGLIMVAVGLWLVSPPAPASAQWRAESHSEHPRPGQDELPGHPLGLGLAGVGGAALGAAGGTVAAIALANIAGTSGPNEGWSLLFAGYFLGAGAGSAVGVHWANQGRGDLAEGMLLASVVGAMGVLGVHAVGGGSGLPGLAIAVPLASVVTAVRTERRTSRRVVSPAPAPDSLHAADPGG